MGNAVHTPHANSDSQTHFRQEETTLSRMPNSFFTLSPLSTLVGLRLLTSVPDKTNNIVFGKKIKKFDFLMPCMDDPKNTEKQGFVDMEMEGSEDYTRVTIHRPGHEVTRIYYDCVVMNEEAVDPNPVVVTETGQVANQDPGRGAAEESNFGYGFMENCYRCKGKLDKIDIYMYRGDMPFCSPECRLEEVFADYKTRVKMEEESSSKGNPPNNQLIFQVEDDDLVPASLVVSPSLLQLCLVS